MIRFRALLIAAAIPTATTATALRPDPAFKMAVGRLPESGPDLCSQPTISRLENLPGPTALKRMMAAMVELFCDSFDQVPGASCSTSTTPRTGCTAASNWRCSTPTTTAAASCRSISTRPPPASRWRSSCAPARRRTAPRWRCVLRHVIGRIRARWPAVEILVRGDSHYGRPEAMSVVRAPSRRLHLRPRRQPVLLRQVGRSGRGCRPRPPRRRGREGPPLRRVPLRRQGWPADRRRAPRHRPRRGRTAGRRQPLHRHQPRRPAQARSTRSVYCARGQAENLIKAHKLHLASDRTSCSKATANQFRLLIHTAAYWLMLEPARPGARSFVLARRPVRHDPPLPDQGRRPRHRDGHPHQGRPAVLLSLSGQLDAARRARRQPATLTGGAACPDQAPSSANPHAAATQARTAPLAPPSRTPKRRRSPQFPSTR